MKSLLLITLAAVSTVYGHSAGLFLKRDPKGIIPNPPPPAISYHIHVVFNLSNPTSLQPAIALRDQARKHFAPLLGEDCDGRYDNARLCLIFDHPIEKILPDGPFFSGEWSIFVPVHYVQAVLFWFT